MVQSVNKQTLTSYYGNKNTVSDSRTNNPTWVSKEKQSEFKNNKTEVPIYCERVVDRPLIVEKRVEVPVEVPVFIDKVVEITKEVPIHVDKTIEVEKKIYVERENVTTRRALDEANLTILRLRQQLAEEQAQNRMKTSMASELNNANRVISQLKSENEYLKKNIISKSSSKNDNTSQLENKVAGLNIKISTTEKEMKDIKAQLDLERDRSNQITLDKIKAEDKNRELQSRIDNLEIEVKSNRNLKNDNDQLRDQVGVLQREANSRSNGNEIELMRLRESLAKKESDIKEAENKVLKMSQELSKIKEECIMLSRNKNTIMSPAKGMDSFETAEDNEIVASGSSPNELRHLMRNNYMALERQLRNLSNQLKVEKSKNSKLKKKEMLLFLRIISCSSEIERISKH